MEPQSMSWNILFEFITKFGLPTFMVIYLLMIFSKKMDRLITLVDRLTGIIIRMENKDRGDFDVNS